MRYFIYLISILFISACQMQADTNKSTPNAPNVIIILTDDQGWGDVHLHGNDSLQTPTLDFLAQNSQNFDRFYVSPVCAPTRAAMLTGRYPARTGVTGVTNREEVMRTGEVTLAEILQENGYTTGMFGKWHNGEQFPNNPLGQGFDQFFGFTAGHWNNYFNTQLNYNGTMVSTEGYITDLLTDSALTFIEKNQNNPFLCYLAYNTPHSPFQVPEQYFQKYKAMGFDDKNASVYGMVENIDDNVERVMEQLQNLKLDKNTILIFFTDNGPNGHRYNGSMKGVKGWVDEGGIRVPFYLYHPGRYNATKTIKNIAGHIDILPTVLDLCEIELPAGLQLDGKSLVSLMEGAPNWQERYIYTNWGGKGSLRNDRYRLVIQQKDTFLYDMYHDPGQHLDIYSKEQITGKEMAAAYEKIQENVNKLGTNPPPIPVGYDEAPVISMPAHEATLHQGLQYKEGHGWANDWIVNWTSTSAFATWRIEVVQAGDFQVNLKYNTPDGSGALVQVKIGEKIIESNISEDFPGEPIESPDWVPRKEVYERTWGNLDAGTIHLEPGEYELQILAKDIPEATAMELKAVELVKVK